jgi:cellulose synthase/poly-beta-1,6-N-acetylglucosamine synthase-like glycosyltransferase
MEVLFPTVAAAVALEPSHETYVLDDGRRLWVRAMAASLGARYIAREEHTHAKAGNVNHALALLDLDVVGILDANHIADSGFLMNTLGYFTAPTSVAARRLPGRCGSCSPSRDSPSSGLPALSPGSHRSSTTSCGPFTGPCSGSCEPRVSRGGSLPHPLRPIRLRAANCRTPTGRWPGKPRGE